MATLNFKRIGAAVALLILWAGIGLAHDRPLAPQDWAALVPLRCPLAFFFDIPCPTCGLGRSLVAAALGQPRTSWHFHPFGLPLFWGSQTLLLIGVIWPGVWQGLRRVQKSLARRPLLLAALVLLYSLWGFCWRAPI